MLELMIKIRPAIEFAGRDDGWHKGSTPARALNRDAIEAGFQIALAAQADDLVSHLPFIEEQ